MAFDDVAQANAITEIEQPKARRSLSSSRPSEVGLCSWHGKPGRLEVGASEIVQRLEIVRSQLLLP